MIFSMFYLINLTQGVLTMKQLINESVHKKTECEYFDSLDYFENFEVTLEFFIADTYGPATSSVIGSLYPTHFYQ